VTPKKPPVSAKPIVVLMGVSGAGKTTVGRLLAGMLGAELAEGDAFHPKANVAKMAAGTPLDDADRQPWLEAIAQAIDRARAEGRGLVVACSALKRRYREVLIGARPGVALVYLRGSRALIGGRLGARKGHFMPPELLDSQFAALEEPGADERPIVVDIAPPPGAVAAEIAQEIDMRLGSTSTSPA
jgi:gluconokinase